MDAIEGKIIPLMEEPDKTSLQAMKQREEKMLLEKKAFTLQHIIVCSLINQSTYTMPLEYFEFLNAWELVPKEQRNLTLLRERLCVVEMCLQEIINDETSALTAKMKPKLYASKKKGIQRDP
ncbi:hypothetical protein PR048_008378, partial [Dryococelus australis]